MTTPLDAIVIGAGPYGLAVGSTMRSAGAEVRVFGEAMSFWKQHMPKGMCLRSRWSASHIGEPRGALSLDAFEHERAADIARPVPLADFVAYGEWFQARTLPDLDPRTVRRVEPRDCGFSVILADGEAIAARRVVVAAGIAPFAARPALFDTLPRELASHSVDHADLAAFAGRRVAVIGGGQSAIESAVLLREAGAQVEVIMRAPRLRWVGRAPREGLLGPILFDRTDVGPALISHLVAKPMLVRALPRALQLDAKRRGARIELRLDDGTTRTLDHVLLATGYRIEIRRYAFLPPELVAQVRSVDGHPVLDPGLQSSIPGLHFVGAPALYSFGPLLRFVAGTEFAARMVTRGVTRARTPGRTPEGATELQRVAQ